MSSSRLDHTHTHTDAFWLKPLVACTAAMHGYSFSPVVNELQALSNLDTQFYLAFLFPENMFLRQVAF